ncbi:MAG: hypothetical protein QG574_4209 [Cyanobacteriota bacterium erpe_2018_sw_21hr_WHONDRS-SW48-000092_B_bin.40]|jgi:hypothetical protein|nr:hypothetical protein [Cyanobacteriota bacterium erpe_2018_sw_21hr_WHONDRS-SW48-000092_B_bin.40]
MIVSRLMILLFVTAMLSVCGDVQVGCVAKTCFIRELTLPSNRRPKVFYDAAVSDPYLFPASEGIFYRYSHNRSAASIRGSVYAICRPLRLRTGGMCATAITLS